MIDLITTLPEISRAAATLFFQWSWQALCVVAVTFAIGRLLGSYPAALRHKLWLICLAAIAALPLLSFLLWSFPVKELEKITHFGSIPAGLMHLANGIDNAAKGQMSIDLLGWVSIGVVLIWLAGVSICLVRAYRARKELRRIVKEADEIEDITGLPSDGLPPGLRILVSTEISNPLLAGGFKPMILVPAGIEVWSTPDDLRAIIRHELTHMERRDHIVQIFQVILEALFFFHPAVRFALDQLSFERELACDEAVINSGISKARYTETLLKAAEHALDHNEGRHQLAFIPKKQLNRRINKIMNFRNKTISGKARVALLAISAVLIGGVAWFVSPNWSAAQHNPHGHLPSTVHSTDKAAVTADDKTTESFKAMYQGIREAILKSDQAAFEGYFADDYTATGPNGMTLNKQQVVSTHIQKATPDMKLEKVEFSDMKVKTHGNTVIVNYVAEMSGVHNGKQVSHSARIMDVWEKKGDKWQSIASHASHNE